VGPKAGIFTNNFISVIVHDPIILLQHIESSIIIITHNLIIPKKGYIYRFVPWITINKVTLNASI
jgi:hypothetical protein